MIALALALVLQQDAPAVDVPVYRDAAQGVAVPRPFADWLFSPATERGTTTIILHPRHGALSDELWGALVITRWDGPLVLGEVADRRLRTTWRPTLGATFRLLARDSVTLAGFPAVRVVMSGVIANAVVEIEEFLVARGPDLVVLQLRYPRGLPRDSIADGYARTLAGLRLGIAADAPAFSRAASGSLSPSSWTAAIERGQLVFETPQELRAVAPGSLTSELATSERRVTRYSPVIGSADTSLYVVGRYRTETRRVGRLLIRIWRQTSPDSSVPRVTDSLIAVAADAWARYWKAFGAVPVAELALVETAWRETRGAPAMVFVGQDATDDYIVRRELSRTWWGGAVPATASDSLLRVALPEWAATVVAVNGALPSSAIEQARLAAGEARFREALRTMVVESRGGTAATDDFLRMLGDTASLPIRAILR